MRPSKSSFRRVACQHWSPAVTAYLASPLPDESGTLQRQRFARRSTQDRAEYNGAEPVSRWMDRDSVVLVTGTGSRRYSPAAPTGTANRAAAASRTVRHGGGPTFLLLIAALTTQTTPNSASTHAITTATKKTTHQTVSWPPKPRHRESSPGPPTSHGRGRPHPPRSARRPRPQAPPRLAAMAGPPGNVPRSRAAS
jgi:hypothetical protein